MVDSLVDYSQKKLGFNKPPEIEFRDDVENAKKVLGKTAYYDPTNRVIVIYKSNRHEKDQLRSLSHEIVHHFQNCNGNFDGITGIGEQGYAQNNKHLREMEREAYERGNLIFRDWEDGMKKQRLEEAKRIVEDTMSHWEEEFEDDGEIVPPGDKWNVEIVCRGNVTNEFEMIGIDYESCYKEVKELARGCDFEIQPIIESPNDVPEMVEEMLDAKRNSTNAKLNEWCVK